VEAAETEITGVVVVFATLIGEMPVTEVTVPEPPPPPVTVIVPLVLIVIPEEEFIEAL
jgi:hypothetical protein